MAKTNKVSKTAPPTGTPRITKTQAKRFLARVPEQNAFWCSDGHVFRDIQELKDALPRMSDQTFCYHCNDEKKDFSNWIRDVIGDANLAKTLETVPDREQAARVVDERCSMLASKVR
jgi:alpha-amylase